MKRLSIPVLDEGLNPRHESTTWQISRTIAFDDLLDEIVKTEEFKNVYFSPVNLLPDEVGYVRCKRFFDDETETDWLPRLLIRGYIDPTSGDQMSLNKVEPPIISVSENITDNDSEVFTINSSGIRTNHSHHKSTTWIIKDENDEIIFKRMNDETNKTSMEVNKNTINLSNYNYIKIFVSHENSDNGISKFSKIDKYVGNYGFVVNEDLSNVDSSEPLEITIDWSNDVEYNLFNKIEIIDPDVQVIKEEILNVSNNINIPLDNLSTDKYYIIRFYPKNREINEIVYNDYSLKLV